MKTRREFLKSSVKTTLAVLTASKASLSSPSAYGQFLSNSLWRTKKKFIASFGFGVYGTSSDGLKFDYAKLPPVTSNANDGCSYDEIVWTGSTYLAFGGGGGGYATATALNGTWTARTLPWDDTGVSTAIVAGSLVFALSDDGKKAAISSDTVNWTSSSLPTSETWSSVAWNGTVFCIISGTDKVATSPDGFTWTLRNVPESHFWAEIIWNGSVFCMTPFESDRAATSPDGITWTMRTLPQSNYWDALTLRGTTIYACGTNMNVVAYSSDNGATWSTASLSMFAYDIASSPTITLTVTGASIQRSTDGTTFSFASASGGVPFKVRYVNGFFVGLSIQSSGQNGITYSTTGATGSWTGRAMPYLRSSGQFNALASNGNRYCLVSNANNVSLVSTDGKVWTSGTLPSIANWSLLASNGTGFVAVATGSTSAATSSDGITWTARTLPSSGAWIDLAWNGNVYCLIASSGTVALTSPDGVTWTSRTIPSGSWKQIVWNGSLFCVIGGTTTTALTSPDGITWTSRTLPVSASWTLLTWTGKMFYAFTVTGPVAISPDGITWTAGTNLPAFTPSNAVWNNNKLIVYTYNPYVTHDGTSWAQYPSQLRNNVKKIIPVLP